MHIPPEMKCPGGHVGVGSSISTWAHVLSLPSANPLGHTYSGLSTLSPSHCCCVICLPVKAIPGGQTSWYSPSSSRTQEPPNSLNSGGHVSTGSPTSIRWQPFGPGGSPVFLQIVSSGSTWYITQCFPSSCAPGGQISSGDTFFSWKQNTHNVKLLTGSSLNSHNRLLTVVHCPLGQSRRGGRVSILTHWF